MNGLKLQSAQMLETVISSSTSRQTFLYGYSSVYQTYNPLKKNNFTSKYCWRRPQTHNNALISNHLKKSAVASSAYS